MTKTDLLLKEINRIADEVEEATGLMHGQHLVRKAALKAGKVIAKTASHVAIQHAGKVHYFHPSALGGK